MLVESEDVFFFFYVFYLFFLWFFLGFFLFSFFFFFNLFLYLFSGFLWVLCFLTRNRSYWPFIPRIFVCAFAYFPNLCFQQVSSLQLSPIKLN